MEIELGQHCVNAEPRFHGLDDIDCVCNGHLKVLTFMDLRSTGMGELMRVHEVKIQTVLYLYI